MTDEQRSPDPKTGPDDTEGHGHKHFQPDPAGPKGRIVEPADDDTEGHGMKKGHTKAVEPADDDTEGHGMKK